MRSVTAVIPTVGRPSLARAVRSVLDQSVEVTELIVVADTKEAVSLPNDERIRLLCTPFRGGASRCRQLGIDAARGSVIALLDDDDEWYPEKLERQLQATDAEPDAHWIASSRMAVLGPGDRRRIWPRRLIASGESVPDYLYRFTDLSFGGALLQSSTLCFPADLARKVRWDVHADSIHDEPSWLIAVQRAVPDVRLIQLPDVLGAYHVGTASLSRDPVDRSQRYIEWGLQHLSSEPPRVLGDYLCSSPVSAAVSAGSLDGVRRSVQAALVNGRPGPYAMAYAAMSAVRIVLHTAVAAIRR